MSRKTQKRSSSHTPASRKTAIRRIAALAFAILTPCVLLTAATSRAASLTNSLTTASCPFCAAPSPTLDQEMDSMDISAFVKLTKALKSSSEPGIAQVTIYEFEVVDVLKGGDTVAKGDSVEIVYFGEAQPGAVFLAQAIKTDEVKWSTPMPVTPDRQKYLKTLVDLPETGAKRLEYFQQFLENSDDLLANDAYDEFARAPYEDVKQLKDAMDHDALVKWLQDPDIPASRKRLYYTLLGVCGSKADLPMLEELMASPQKSKKAGLDAMIACYLTLAGPEGMPRVEDLFLKNEEVEYADTYGAITALRFHGTESDVIPRERILAALRLVLERPDLADLVIPDLARWEDWSVVDQLVTLFKESDEKSNWVRVPVVNYLRACPLPEAKTHLEELKKIDPDSIRRANTFFPLLDEEEEDEEDTEDTDEDAGKIKPTTKDDGNESDQDTPSVSANSASANDSTANKIVALRPEIPAVSQPQDGSTPADTEESDSTKSSHSSTSALLLVPIVAATGMVRASQTANQPSQTPVDTPATETPSSAAEPAQFVSTASQSIADRGMASREVASGDSPTTGLLASEDSMISRLLVVSVMAVLSLVIFAIQWSILTGSVLRFFT